MATASPAASPAATASPVATASPAATATPAEAPAADMSSEEGISNLRDLIDKQVEDKVLTSKEVTEKDQVVTLWSGADGIRRIDVKSVEGAPTSEKAQYYFQGKHLFSFGGSGTRPGAGEKVEKYTFWAGIAENEKLVGPPFQFIAGKPAPYPEDDVREREDVGIQLHQKYEK